ncbi:hypothetical protein QFZ88_004143 [Mesorhizobium sp. YL-MeA3-2017]|jgi:hypothetical protein|nr:hypothetical protein [Mesorhizobium sp. YL-MeA3-2017]
MSFLHLDTKYPSRFLSDWGVPIVAAIIILFSVYLMI